MHITSLQNGRIKWLIQLRTSSRDRRGEGLFVVEGIDEIQLALSAGHRPMVVVEAPDLTRRKLAETEGEQLTVTRAVFQKLSVRENPDGWIAVFKRPAWSLEEIPLGPNPLILVMESVEKPGNLGAILRTADAAAVSTVVVCDPRADIFSPNVVRASRGALFSVPVVELSSARTLAFLKERGIRVVAANPNAGRDFQKADFSGGLAIAMGTEDAGLSQVWLENADLHVLIPMRGKVNSLNVSVAAALLLYEALRQRR
jgi:TrmH family RNA methyltransferase